MQTIIFLVLLGAVLLTLSIRAFLRLPQKEGQMLAAIPIESCGTAVWSGVNLTGYGLYNAIAYALAGAITILLLGSIQVPIGMVLLVFGALIAACIPASSIMARLIEGKRHTLTVGGASFVGILVAPWIVLAGSTISLQAGMGPLPVVPILAAFAIAYTFGEGIGRLACISFGCCYGRPVDGLSPRLQALFGPIAFRFKGHTRKVAYAGNLENVPLVPIQAMTNILFLVTGLFAMLLYLRGHYTAACLSCLFITQIWRISSEFLRADFRGQLRFSAYQRMSLAGLVYIAILLPLLPAGGVGGEPQLVAGLRVLWSPGILLALQGLFVFAFIFTGRSSVTASTIKFYIRKDRI